MSAQIGRTRCPRSALWAPRCCSRHSCAAPPRRRRPRRAPECRAAPRVRLTAARMLLRALALCCTLLLLLLPCGVQGNALRGNSFTTRLGPVVAVPLATRAWAVRAAAAVTQLADALAPPWAAPLQARLAAQGAHTQARCLRAHTLLSSSHLSHRNTLQASRPPPPRACSSPPACGSSWRARSCRCLHRWRRLCCGRKIPQRWRCAPFSSQETTAPIHAPSVSTQPPWSLLCCPIRAQTRAQRCRARCR
jgi:hypothetical protein